MGYTKPLPSQQETFPQRSLEVVFRLTENKFPGKVFGTFWKRETSYCLVNIFTRPYDVSPPNISWSLKAARLDVIMIASLCNVPCTSATLLLRCLSNFRTIGKVYPDSRGFETPRDLVVRCLTAQLIEPLCNIVWLILLHSNTTLPIRLFVV